MPVLCMSTTNEETEALVKSVFFFQVVGLDCSNAILCSAKVSPTHAWTTRTFGTFFNLIHKVLKSSVH